MNSIDIDVIRTALDWQSRGHRVVMGTVVRTWGSAPRPPGSLMIIRDDGQVAGSVSGGCIEDDLIRRVAAWLRPCSAGSRSLLTSVSAPSMAIQAVTSPATTTTAGPAITTHPVAVTPLVALLHGLAGERRPPPPGSTQEAPMSTSHSSLDRAPATDDSAVQHGQTLKSVYVYEAPVRIWHWINALAITVLAITGYFIGVPLPTQPGEASANYLMGYIRFAHFAAGYLLAVGIAGRAYWALVGNHHARELFWVPVFQKAYWAELFAMLKWYAFISARPGRYVGHNPLARLAMFSGFLMITLFMIVTGFALYGEGAQMGSWQERLFGWVIPLFGQSQDVHTWHRMGLWAMVMFVILHVYAAIREDIMGRQSIVSTMISGYRTFKD
eukprot:gene23424-28422_t